MAWSRRDLCALTSSGFAAISFATALVSPDRTAAISAASFGSTGLGGPVFFDFDTEVRALVDPGAENADLFIRERAVGGICRPPSPFTSRRMSLLSALLPGIITGP